jgi:hypothetical protein
VGGSLCGAVHCVGRFVVWVVRCVGGSQSSERSQCLHLPRVKHFRKNSQHRINLVSFSIVILVYISGDNC